MCERANFRMRLLVCSCVFVRLLVDHCIATVNDFLRSAAVRSGKINQNLSDKSFVFTAASFNFRVNYEVSLRSRSPQERPENKNNQRRNHSMFHVWNPFGVLFRRTLTFNKRRFSEFCPVTVCWEEKIRQKTSESLLLLKVSHFNSCFPDTLIYYASYRVNSFTDCRCRKEEGLHFLLMSQATASEP